MTNKMPYEVHILENIVLVYLQCVAILTALITRSRSGFTHLDSEPTNHINDIKITN